MSFYEAFRHFADSYGLMLIVTLYVMLCSWAFLPGGKRRVDEAKHSIFKEHDDGEF